MLGLREDVDYVLYNNNNNNIAFIIAPHILVLSSRAHYYPDFDLFHTNTHLNSPGSIQHMQPNLAQRTKFHT